MIIMKTQSEFLEEVGVDMEVLEEMLRHDAIDDVFFEFGSRQDLGLSARPSEHGVYEISDADENYSLSFLLPFDKNGALAGPGRITFEDRLSVIESRVLDMEVSHEIWTQVEEEIQEALPDLSGESTSDASLCLADHRFWVLKQAGETASSTGSPSTC
ncbi:MAG: hypothetical protein ACJASC_003241 [Limimaricola cinnabarinus]|jgi:hypothetical protein|uniref:hypothetical protein n=1 Tax=Limimaricola cinnabarinus TaxID=1125964 RepID=UPI0039E59EB4